ncbi:hypothetical protein Tco_0683068 [Tanacetum coccineum]|uniref:Uncharacterized protein n=1 Tax=Tanacetum coccineum TaxID=301880 RepID=A0ABQ4XT04_9ASTR
MNSKIATYIDLDQFSDILQKFCPKVDIRIVTDVNVNKLHQPWRSFAAIINKCLSGIPSYDSLRLSQAQILWGMYNKKNVDYAYLLWEDFIFKIENKNTKKGNAMYYPRFTKLVVNFVMEKDPSIPRRNKVNWHYARDDPMFTTINVISRNEATQLYGAILPVALTNEDIRNSESYKEYYARASGTIPPKTKGSKKKANTDSITKQKPPTAPKEKKSGKAKQKTTELETISEADLTETEQLKIITKRSRQETHSSHASGSGADEGTGVTPGVPDAPDYDSEDDISWKSSDDDQDDEQAQDDEDAGKNDVNETTQDDEDDDDHDDDEKVQDADEHDVDKTVQEDDDEEQTESDDDGDDFVHPKLTTHDDEIIHEEDTDEDDSRVDVEGEKSDEDATDEEDKGNETDKDTKANLEGRDDVMTDVILPQVQATQEIEDTHVTLTPVNPDGQQQSSSVSSGFVSNMLNPNQDTEPSFFAPTNRPPTSNPLFIQLQQPPILTPATTPSSSLQNLPDFASLFGFDNRLKALEDNFSEFKQTNQYAEALYSIPGIVDQYLETKLKEAVDVAVQLKYDRIREEAHTDNQQFLDSIDEGMKKVIKEQVKKEVSKITPQIEKLVNEQLESEVLRSLQGIRLMAYEADKFWLESTTSGSQYGHIKMTRDGEMDDQEPSAETDRGSKERKKSTKPQQKNWTGSTPKAANILMICESHYRWFQILKVVMLYRFITSSITDLEVPMLVVSKPKYSTSVTKTTAADYGHIKWIEDLVPNSMWSQMIVNYDKFALWGISHWGKKRRQFYAFATTRESARVVGDFHRIRIQDIDDMLLLSRVRGKVRTNLTVEEQDFIYENKDKKNRLMRIDELHKFSDGTLDDVRTALNDRLKGIRMEYLPQTFWSQRDKVNARAMIQAIDKRLRKED